MRFLRRDDGLSMVEMMVASALFLLVIVSVFSLLDSGTKAERGQQVRGDALLETRSAMTRMSRDIRQALSVAPTSTRSRLDIQTYISGVPTRVVYELTSAKEITRSVGTSGPIVLVTGVSGAYPFCFDPDSACVATAPTDTLSKVRINLSVLPDTSGARPITLATDVELRNR